MAANNAGDDKKPDGRDRIGRSGDGHRVDGVAVGAGFAAARRIARYAWRVGGGAGGSGARFMGLVHHTDADREWAYDRDSSTGRLDKALDEAQAKGWTVVDMKKDWKRVFTFENK